MIKLILADEEPKPSPMVRFEFRRHQQPAGTNTEHQAFLVGEIVSSPVMRSALYRCYPIKIDGAKETVEIRKRDFEALGFTVVVKD